MTFIKTAGIGYPVNKSKSPIIYGHWMKQYDIAGAYDLFEIAPKDLEAGVKKLIEQDYTGFSVTLPHKQAVMALCDEVDESAQEIGAVNSVKITDGKLYATNTDRFGFIENIKPKAPGFMFGRGPAVVLGAGGAARAVISGLLREGVPEIILTNRTRDRAEELKSMNPSKIRVIGWSQREEILKEARLLVNTTSLGMEGQPKLEISLKHLPEKALVNDIVYYPLMTDLLKEAQAQGNKIVTGIGMLIHQARPSFKNWHGVEPEVTDELEAKVLA